MPKNAFRIFRDNYRAINEKISIKRCIIVNVVRVEDYCIYFI